ncbi:MULTISPECIES: YkgJ family cysteine cluster protein [unclassified Neochlamydia]|uniref:YkgJ family cysteine cluster protein n=1 Tax=unclassified Neochlamydia TaxID=2643326 RepID=UPI001F614752|nr:MULTISPECIES: YkgJ family cysteine cluster protein [unclassified Neochlamydia]
MMDKNNDNTQTSKSLPWYKEGLRFQCTECGKCCTGSPGYVWITELEMQAVAKLLKISLELFKKKYTRQRENRYSLIEKKNLNNEYDCIFLKDKKCSIYQERPRQCRTFPWWKENLASEESWKAAAQYCEGIHEEAALVPYEKIEQQLHLNQNSLIQKS